MAISAVVDVDADAGEPVARFDGGDHVHGFGELDTLVPAYLATVHKNPGLGASGGGHSHADAALRHAAAEPALHRGGVRDWWCWSARRGRWPSPCATSPDDGDDIPIRSARYAVFRQPAMPSLYGLPGSTTIRPRPRLTR